MNDSTNTTPDNNASENELQGNEQNKAQPGLAASKTDGDNSSLAHGVRDTERVSDRANEAPDSTDTNTGGMISGGAKGASQS